MNYFSGVMQTVLPVLIVLLIGRWCRSGQKISREGLNTLKTVAVDIALPAVLLRAFATTQYDFRSIIIPVVMFLICLLGWGIGKGIRKGLRRTNDGQDVFLPFITSGFEAGMLGYTLFEMLYGAANTASFALVDLGQVLFVFTVYKGLLNAEFAERQNTGKLLKAMITSPIIIATAVGVFLGATGIYRDMEQLGLRSIFDACVGFVAAPTSVLILLSIGFDLVLKDIQWGRVLRDVLIRFALMMALMVGTGQLISALFPGDDQLMKALYVMFILPPPYVLPIFAKDDAQAAYLSSTLTVSTMLSIACFAVLALL